MLSDQATGEVRGAAMARAPKPMTADNSCPFVVAAASYALWQFEKDRCGFAFDAAKKDGIIYAVAVGFDPMPGATPVRVMAELPAPAESAAGVSAPSAQATEGQLAGNRNDIDLVVWAAMQITLADEHSARAVSVALERYGYRAQRRGPVVLTDCPILLAVGVAERTVGLQRVRQAELAPSPGPEATHELGQAAC